MTNQIRAEQEGPLLVMHLENGPEALLDVALVRAISRQLDVLESQRGQGSPRVLMLTGTVPGVFVRRYDVEEFFSADAAAENPELDALPRLIARLEGLDVITVAALNGTALGGGFELALGCDFRIACDGPSRFGFRETDVGLIPGAGGTQRLVRLLGIAKTLELVLLGKLLKPREALDLGLLHAVLDRDDFAAGARRFCRDLAQRAPLALALAKQVIRRGAEMPFEDALRFEREAFKVCARSEDARAAVSAYSGHGRYVFRGE